MNDSQVYIRIATPSDAEKLRAMFAHSSQKTIYRRFHTPFPEVPNWMVSLMLEADHHDKESLVAVAEEKVVGHAMYAREGDGSEAEMAILVEDEWQSMGIGKSLLSELEERARHRGIETFVAEVLGENRPMLGLAARSFAGTGYAIEDGVYHVRMPLREAAALDLRAA
jgi:GNAT superfamily N-acetyltransferase